MWQNTLILGDVITVLITVYYIQVSFSETIFRVLCKLESYDYYYPMRVVIICIMKLDRVRSQIIIEGGLNMIWVDFNLFLY